MPTITYANIGKFPIKPTLQDIFGYGDGGAAYAFPDLSSLYQDAAGTVPVTAIGQQVYLDRDISDRSNHLLQATALARPRLGRTPAGGVRNVLIRTDNITGGGWTLRSITVTNGGDESFKITENSISDVHHIAAQVSVTAGLSYTTSVELKPIAEGDARHFIVTSTNTSIMPIRFSADLVNGTIVGGTLGNNITIEPLDDGWFRLSATAIATSTANISMYLPRIVTTAGATSYQGDGVSGMFFRKPYVGVTGANNAYQRVTSDWDVTEAGKADCWYLGFDGIDDFMVTAATLDLSATDKVTLFAGVEKFTDASIGAVAEFSADVNSNLGT